MPKKTTPDFLAVAFTQGNNNDKFDKADTVIAGISDANHDGVVSVGDTVTFGTIPDTDGTPLGAYTHADSSVQSVLLADIGRAHPVRLTSGVNLRETGLSRMGAGAEPGERT